MKKHLILASAAFSCFTLSAIADDDPAKANWDRQCKKCHAEDGSGSTKMGQKLEIKDYTKAETLAEFCDEDLFKMTKEGVEGTKMKGYAAKLSDEDITALVAYMRAMAKAE